MSMASNPGILTGQLPRNQQRITFEVSGSCKELRHNKESKALTESPFENQDAVDCCWSLYNTRPSIQTGFSVVDSTKGRWRQLSALDQLGLPVNAHFILTLTTGQVKNMDELHPMAQQMPCFKTCP